MPYMLLAALLVAPAASARTWTVGVLGTIGVDFRDIKLAVDAAAPGDTILIGPGRFDQLHNVVAPGWTEEAIVPATKNDLTFIGAGAGQTIIGKSTLYVPPERAPKAICSIEAHDVLIRGVTIENMRTGIYWYRGNLNVEDCEFRGSLTAMTFWVDGGHINNCTFDVSGNTLALAPGLTEGIEISNCRFAGYGQGLGTGTSARHVNFTDCEFEGNRAAIGYDGWSSGTLRNVTITGTTSVGVAVTYNSEVTMDGVHIDGGVHGVRVVSGSILNAANLIVENTTLAAVEVSSEALVAVHQSHLLPIAGYAVRAISFFSDVVSQDFTGNWWGTQDGALVADLVHDMNDDSGVHCLVNVDPIAAGPVPTESTSWGDLKASFR